MAYDTIETQAEKNAKEKLTGTNKKGVKRVPYCNIPFEHTIFSLLHALIGIGNQIIKYLEYFIDTKIEKQTTKEITMRRFLPLLEGMWREMSERVNIWDKSMEGGFVAKQDGKGKEISEARNFYACRKRRCCIQREKRVST